MNYLIDTSVAVWAFGGSDRLDSSHRALLQAEKSTIYLSIVSLWEIATKVAIGKLEVTPGWQSEIEESGFVELGLHRPHIEAYQVLPLLHRDPFDRMLIAQAQVEGLTVMTTDRRFSAYDVKVAEA